MWYLSNTLYSCWHLSALFWNRILRLIISRISTSSNSTFKSPSGILDMNGLTANACSVMKNWSRLSRNREFVTFYYNRYAFRRVTRRTIVLYFLNFECSDRRSSSRVCCNGERWIRHPRGLIWERPSNRCYDENKGRTCERPEIFIYFFFTIFQRYIGNNTKDRKKGINR